MLLIFSFYTVQKGSFCYSQVSPNKPLCADHNQSSKCIWNGANTATFYSELNSDFFQEGRACCVSQFHFLKLEAHVKLQWVVETGECVTDQLGVMLLP